MAIGARVMVNLSLPIVPDRLRFAAQPKAWPRAPFSRRGSAQAAVDPRVPVSSGNACAVQQVCADPRQHRIDGVLLRRDVANPAESLKYARAEQAVSGEGGPP